MGDVTSSRQVIEGLYAPTQRRREAAFDALCSHWRQKALTLNTDSLLHKALSVLTSQRRWVYGPVCVCLLGPNMICVWMWQQEMVLILQSDDSHPRCASMQHFTYFNHARIHDGLAVHRHSHGRQTLQGSFVRFGWQTQSVAFTFKVVAGFLGGLS